jgi:hypothetical protein
LAPRFSFVNSICRDSRIVANGRYRVDLTHSSGRRRMTRYLRIAVDRCAAAARQQSAPC